MYACMNTCSYIGCKRKYGESSTIIDDECDGEGASDVVRQLAVVDDELLNDWVAQTCRDAVTGRVVR